VNLVLLDADHYLGDPRYRTNRRAGLPALRNLWAFDSHGKKVWEAELPESNDYYYEIVDVSPLTVRSFSGYTCELEIRDGTITSKDFQK
jgi:hypothetical protein